mmetsp:Transcript_41903/g.131369  ORF Transcript_41903/g.131369 Transcript_41903/m.131369 type:complete len:99 (-) Transcript_41903:87-383(-)
MSGPAKRAPLKKGVTAAEGTSRRREDAGRHRRAARAGRLSSKRRVLMEAAQSSAVAWTEEELRAVLRELQAAPRSDATRLAAALLALQRILACEACDP